MVKKNILLYVFVGLFIISLAFAITIFLKYTELNNQFKDYSDYGGIKIKLPIDSNIEAIVVASSSNDFNEILNSGIDYYSVTPRVSDNDDKFSVIFSGRYDYNLVQEPYYFVVSKDGSMKTNSDFLAEKK